jgi:peptidoglycan hydrolase-like protein with peptidoglycan-binding domain
MNWMSLLVAILPSLLQLAPKVIAIFEGTATDNSLVKVADFIKTTPIADILAKIGAAQFPTLAPELQAAAAALVHSHTNGTAWAQDALNIIASTGYITLPAPLKVDGYWGPRTMAAVKALQVKIGVPVTGFLADMEYSVIGALLARGVAIPA